MERHAEVLKRALGELDEAQKRMRAPTAPATPAPRPRVFWLAAKIHWPVYGSSGPEWQCMRDAGNNSYYLYLNTEHTVDRLMSACGYRPRHVLRCLRRIQAATAWCDARAEGRRRQAEEILRQQAGAVAALDAEAAMAALRK